VAQVLSLLPQLPEPDLQQWLAATREGAQACSSISGLVTTQLQAIEEQLSSCKQVRPLTAGAADCWCSPATDTK
jgi:hypothetical protein